MHVYSEGVVEDFQDLLGTCTARDEKKMQLSFHLNDNVFSTFHHLVSADLLIMSKSDFSFVAGILSKGIKLFCPVPFWRVPLPGWLLCGTKKEEDVFNVEDMKVRITGTHVEGKCVHVAARNNLHITGTRSVYSQLKVRVF